MKRTNILVTGASLYGNLGAIGMSIVVVRHLLETCPDAQVIYVEKYPRQARANAARFFPEKNVSILEARQIPATFRSLPLAAARAVLPGAGRGASHNDIVRTFEEAHIVFDIGGITFSSERPLSGLLINATWLLLGVLGGAPVVKLSQAYGPAPSWWFRRVSAALLGRAKKLVARGDESYATLERMGLADKACVCADLVFLLGTEETDDTRRVSRGNCPLVIGIAPSAILYGRMGRKRYLPLIVETIERLAREHPDAQFWLYAHCFRHEETLNNNDMPVCQAVFAGLSADVRRRARLIGGDYSPGEMKSLIAMTDVFLSSRFHAMVSALACGVPVAVVGWSHKYREVLKQFDLDTAISERMVTVDSLGELMSGLVRDREAYRNKIASHLAGVKESAQRNLELIGEELRKLAGRPGGQE